MLEQPVVDADPLARGRHAPGGGRVRALGLVERDAAQAEQLGATVRAVRARHPQRADHQRQPVRRGERVPVLHQRRPAHRAPGHRYLPVQPDPAAGAHHVPVGAHARHARGQGHAHRALEQPAHPFADVADQVQRPVRRRGPHDRHAAAVLLDRPGAAVASHLARGAGRDGRHRTNRAAV